jgi:glycosyltransferase involved in cell wall biosynthesis
MTLLNAKSPLPLYVVILKEGPTHSLEDIQPHCEVLAQRFSGELWTYGGYDADVRIGGMRLRVIDGGNGNKFQRYRTFFRAVVGRARALRMENRGRTIVVSYDPFKTGFLASRFARIVKGKFISEVNGAYGDPDTFADIRSGAWRNIRLLQMRLLGGYVLRRADGVKLLFDAQLDGFARPNPHAILRRFFDIAYIDRFHDGEEEPIILLAGYPFRRKGADVLCAAFLAIAERYPEWRLVLIGHELAAGMQTAGIAHPRILVYPGMPQNQLVEWVARSSIVAQPSRSEAMGRILIEAAAAGKCRVATSVNGIPTVIDDEVDGLLVPKDDAGALASALERLMRDSDLRHRLGNAAKERARRDFTADAYLDHYAEFFSALSTE